MIKSDYGKLFSISFEAIFESNILTDTIIFGMLWVNFLHVKHYFYLIRHELHTSRGENEQKLFLVRTQSHLMQSRIYCGGRGSRTRKPGAFNKLSGDWRVYWLLNNGNVATEIIA